MRSIRLIICAFALLTLTMACGGGTSTDPTDTTVTDTGPQTDEGQNDEGTQPDEGQVVLNCDENNGGCDANATCALEADAILCTCVEGYEGDGLTCTDTDECAADNDCGQICTNTEGSYECSCNDGFNLGADGRSCADIDECSAGTHDCDVKAICANNDGSFDCTCVDGYEGDGTVCSDVDECLAETDDCEAPFVCGNIAGSFECVCDSGFSLTEDGDACEDVDECLLEADNCSDDAECTNSDGSFECACSLGYEGDGVDCVDVDECATLEDACGDDGAMATCENTDGSFECLCDEGYGYNAVTTACEDVNECDFPGEYCDINAECTNSDGGFDCACSTGFDGDGLSCIDVDECDLGQDECHESSTCGNLPGTFECVCADGYAYEDSDTGCLDVDECTTNSHDCEENEFCTNDEGSFTCAACGDGTEVGSDEISCVPCEGASAGTGGICTACDLGLIATENKTECVVPGCGVDVSDVAFPYQWPGLFSDDPEFVSPSCDTSVNNAVWFTYVAPESGLYSILVENGTNTNAYSRIAVFSSEPSVLTADSCSPINEELACLTKSGKDATTKLDFVEGEVYLILFYTDDSGSDTYTMVDPEITIELYTPDPGATCSNAVDLTDSLGDPVIGEGIFDMIAPVTGSCDSDTAPGNSFWATFTPDEGGLYDFSFVNNTATAAWSRMAVFADGSCTEPGVEVECIKVNGKTINTTMELNGGVTYTFLLYTDGASYTIVEPTITLTEIATIPGDTCGEAIDLSVESLPYYAAGDFGIDPSTGGSCDTTPTNSVWFDYLATGSGLHNVTVINEFGEGETRLVVFKAFDDEGNPTACTPASEEIACVSGDEEAASASATVDLLEGMAYKILIYTDSDDTQMTNPELNVELISVAQGDVCSQAFAFTDEDLPYTLFGDFDLDGPMGGSCDTTPNNLAWAQYTATLSGPMTVSGQLEDPEGKIRIAIFEGGECAPLGAELACAASDTNLATTDLNVLEGAVYNIAIYTDAETSLNSNPIVSVAPFSADPGQHCLSAFDVTGQTMPYGADAVCPEGAFCGSLEGIFEDDADGGSCDSEAINVAWFSYTPDSTGPYRINGINQTSVFAYSRLAVFEGTDCSDLSVEVACKTSNNKTPEVVVDMEAGKSYTIMFYTDTSTFTWSSDKPMEDPQIKIEPFSYELGESCSAVVDIPPTGEAYTIEGTFSYGMPVGTTTCPYDSGAIENGVWFGYFPMEAGTYLVSVENQTTTAAYGRLAIFEGAGCDPLPTELSCDEANSVASGTSMTKTIVMEAATPYMFVFYTDGSLWTMVDPIVTIEMTAPAEPPTPEE